MRAALITVCAAVVACTWTAGLALAATGATQAYPPIPLAESSGMAASVLHDGVVWVVEDGNIDQSLQPVIHAYDRSAAEVATVTLTGWNNRDVEALSMGPGPALWVADIGDNSVARESVVVHTFPEPAALTQTELEPTSYRLRYPERPRDAEAFMVDPLDGRLYVATKSWGAGGLFAAPATLVPGATHDLEPRGSVPALVTDGAFTPDGRFVVLVAIGFPSEVVVMDVVRGDDGTVAELREVQRLDLPTLPQPESITVAQDGSAVLVGSEVDEGPDQPIWSIPLPVAPAETGATAGPPASSSSTSEPGATAEGPDGCRWSDPGSCLDEPAGWLAGTAVALVALMATALAVLRRSRHH